MASAAVRKQSPRTAEEEPQRLVINETWKRRGKRSQRRFQGKRKEISNSTIKQNHLESSDLKL